MSEQVPPSTAETPILERLREVAAQGEKALANTQVHPGAAGRIARILGSQATKIYGNDSPLPEFRGLRNPSPEHARNFLSEHLAVAKRLIASLEQATHPLGRRVFIGHGRSPIWRELKDFLADRLALPWDEFNREASAGYATVDRLRVMLDQAAFALLVMTAEDEHADARVHARQNVIHELGLFQGRLGMHRAIILIEEGCSEFSNIQGLSQIRFPRGYIGACFEDVRKVLERERLL